MQNNLCEIYRSDISIDSFANKLYVDPQYGRYQPKATVNYSVFRGKWDIEDLREDNSVKMIHRETSDSITLSFNSFKDKIEFVQGIYAEHQVNQIGKGMNLEDLANKNLMPRIENYIDSLIKKIIPIKAIENSN